MPSNNETTTKFNVDISNLKKGIQDANRQIRLANAEFKAAASGMDDWQNSTDGLNSKIKQLETVLDSEKKKLGNLKDQLALVEKEQGSNSKGADELRIAIANQEASVNKTEKSLKGYKSKLSDLEKGNDDAGDAAEEAAKDVKKEAKAADEAEKSNGELAKTLGGGLVKGFAAVGAAAAGLVTGFLSTADSTREYRNDLNKLTAAFSQAGLSAEETYQAFNYFGSVLGDTRKADETMQQLAQLVDTEKDLEEWTDTLTGVYATFGNAIPTETLTEAINHTVQMGEVQGTLSDALEWGGISAESFNEQLAACSDESERTALIQETLNGLYKEAGDEFNELNKDILDANTALTDFENAQANIGAVAEPFITQIRELGASFLNSLVPGLEEAGEGMQGLIDGIEGSDAKLQSGIQSVIDAILGKFTELLPNVLSVGVQIITCLVQGILNALPSVLDAVIEIVPQLTGAILGLLPQLVTVAAQLVSSLVTALGTMLPEVVNQIIEIVPQIVTALVAAIPQLLNAAIQFLMAIVDAIPTIITNLIAVMPQMIDAIITAITTFYPTLIEGALQLLNAIIDAIPIIINKLVPQIPTIINAIVTVFITNTTTIINAALALLMGIVDAIPLLINALVPQLPTIIMAIVNALMDNIPLLFDAAVNLFMTLVDAIPTILASLVGALFILYETVITTFMDPLKKLFEGAWKGIVDTFKNVDKWFKEKFNEAYKNVSDIWSKASGFFNNIWSAIKNVFSVVGTWFKTQFTTAYNNITGAFKTIGTFFSGIWTNIKNVFSVVGTWFKTQFSNAYSGITTAFSGIVGFFSNIWTNIKNIFNKVGEVVGNAITNTVKTAINGVLSTAVRIINGFIGAINSAISVINAIPGVSINKLEKLSVPQLARGGVLKRGQVGLLEGNGAEAVVPLDQNKKWIRKTSQDLKQSLKSEGVLMGGNSNSSVTNNYNFNQTNNSPKALSRLEIYRQTKNQLAFAKGV